MSNLRLNKVRSQTPITILVNGGNRLSYLIAKALIDQGSYVVIIDKFNNETKKYISELKKSELVDFFDFKGFESLFKNIKRFDYMFYFLNEKLQKSEFDSKEFLLETNYLEQSLINTKKNNAKFSLITSLALNRELANRVNGEDVSKPSPYSNIELQKYCENMVAEFGDRNDVNLRIIRLATLIGKGIDTIAVPSIDTMFRDSTAKGQITIYGEGLDIHNLINESDATYGVLKLTFLDSTKKEVITLANKNNYTTLSLAYKLLELNTEAQSIRFVDNPDEKFTLQDLYVPAPSANKYGWTQQISLEESFIEQLQNYYGQANKQWDVQTDQAVVKKKVEKNTKITKTKLGEFVSNITTPIKTFLLKPATINFNWKTLLKGSTLFLVTAIISYFLIYPVIGALLGVGIINRTAKDLSTSFFDVDQNKNLEKVTIIEDNLGRVSESVSNLYWLFSAFGKRDLYNNTFQLINAGENGIKGARQLVEAITPLSMYIRDFEPAVDFGNNSTKTTREYREYLSEMSKSRYKVDDASYRIALASEMMKKVDTRVFPKQFQDRILNLKDLVKEIDESTKLYKEAIVFLPELLGKDGRQRYLVFLQNESEIRATGGWFTSYGIIGVEGGQIREIYVDDVYNADGSLKIKNKKYSPPNSMKNALGINDWSFSLVNWYPDLAETHILAETFTKDLGIGNNIDGVITIDVSFLQKLLNKWGGIEVPGEDSIVTSDNIYTKIFEMHNNFVPGSTQKTTFLANLANEIVKRVLSMKIGDMIGLADVFSSSFEEKHIQATFSNSDALNFFRSRNWAGSLDSKYNSAPTAIDWNWGGNKANLFLDKNYVLNVNVQNKNVVSFDYTISVENKSISENYPYGNYRNYQRIYLPPDAKITKVQGFENNKYEIYKESGFKIVAGWFNTPIKEVSSLNVAYVLERSAGYENFPLELNGNDVFFDLNIFKQAGEKRFAYKVDIEYPTTWKLLENDSLLNSMSNHLTSRFELSGDVKMNIIWEIPN